MKTDRLFTFGWLLVLLGSAGIAYGRPPGVEPLLAVSVVALLLAMARRPRQRPTPHTPGEEVHLARQDEHPGIRLAPDEPPADEDSLVAQMLRQGRYALLLRPQIAQTLAATQLRSALEEFEQRMALVHGGQVVLGSIDELLDDGKLDLAAIEARRARLAEVQPVYLDKLAVTNRQFQEFVRAGCYSELELWDEEILPALADFADGTGCAAPRYWRDGRYAVGEDEHPVVGVSWYEAVAYARWIGKRLPSDAEWVKAGCCPVKLKGGVWLQRKYPWGNSFERPRANLWGSSEGRIVAVDEFAAGASTGGHRQLIGNVWEWTASPFGAAAHPALSVASPMKSIRGGAFDTYFEAQATCHFESGESPLARKHNIGFRLALAARELSPDAAPAPAQETEAHVGAEA